MRLTFTAEMVTIQTENTTTTKKTTTGKEKQREMCSFWPQLAAHAPA